MNGLAIPLIPEIILEVIDASTPMSFLKSFLSCGSRLDFGYTWIVRDGWAGHKCVSSINLSTFWLDNCLKTFEMKQKGRNIGRMGLNLVGMYPWIDSMDLRSSSCKHDDTLGMQ